jgi:hypothetical protein
MDKNKNTCHSFQKCSAPLCPELNNPDNIWYPDEEICRCRKYSCLSWIKKQRKIAKKTVNRDFYFTKDDLDRIRRVTQNTKGQNPDTNKGRDTFKTPLKHHLKPYLSGYLKTITPLSHPHQPDNTGLLKPIVRPDSDTEHQ